MTEYDIVSTFPTSLSCAVLRDWLDLKSTVKLNSAFCNTSRRETFLELLRSDEYSVLGQVTLPYHIDRLKASYSGLWELGGKVRRIFVCHKPSAAEAAFIVQQFPNLTHVHLSALDDTVSELWTLTRCPRIQCIEITYCTCHDESLSSQPCSLAVTIFGGWIYMKFNSKPQPLFKFRVCART